MAGLGLVALGSKLGILGDIQGPSGVCFDRLEHLPS